MKLSIKIGPREAALELARNGQAWLFRDGAGRERRAEVAQLEPGVYSVLIDGRSYEARVEPGAVVVGGRRIEVEVRDPRQFRGGHGGHRGEGPESITAPIPGKVVRLLVAADAEVAAGQPLLVIEAMKMQNELRAPKSGRVVSLPVREGETVAAGAVLATVA